jgi:hypothetical protein
VSRRWPPFAAAVLVIASVLGPASPAAAEITITEVGWWSANPSASAPPGGFAIQGAPDGTSSSVAAIRVLVTPEPIVRAALILTEAGGLSNENAALQVCPTADEWTAVEGGEFTEAPAPDCTTPVPLTRSATSRTWSAEITQLLTGTSQVSLMVVIQPANEAPPPTVSPPPTPGVPPPVPPPVPGSPVAGVPLNAEIQFGPPALSVDLAFSDDAASEDTDFSDLSTGSSSESFIVPTDSSSFVSPSFTGSGSTSFAAPVTATPAADPAGLAAETPIPGQGQVLAGDPPRFQVDAEPRSWPFARMFLFVVVAAVIGAASSFARARLRSATA